MRWATTRWRSGSAVLAVIVVGAVVMPVTTATAAGGTPSAAAHRVAAGVEDGNFSPRCLNGSSGLADLHVAKAVKYRAGLDAHVVRVLVPWNIELRPTAKRTCFNHYLKHASKYEKIEVSLNRSKRKDSPNLARYSQAIKRLGNHANDISYLTAYNEPNNKNYLAKHRAATKAAQMYVRAAKTFHAKVVAGDFASGVSKKFLRTYANHLRRRHLHPTVWALHPYTDISNFQYFLQRQKHKNADAAARSANNHSKTVEFAHYLKALHYGSKTHIWLNEIYVTHLADKCPPYKTKSKCDKATKPTYEKKFSGRNQAYAAFYLDGVLGKDSLPRAVAQVGGPRLTRYVYLRATTNHANKAHADVLKVPIPKDRQRNCIYDALATTIRTIPALCKS